MRINFIKSYLDKDKDKHYIYIITYLDIQIFTYLHNYIFTYLYKYLKMNLDDINKSILGLNTTFKSISESYKNMCSKMHILIDKDLLSYNTLLELEVSMNDLLINVHALTILINVFSSLIVTPNAEIK